MWLKAEPLRTAMI